MSLARQILELLDRLNLTEEDGFETGLDVAKKRTIKGKLEPSDEWKVTKQWSVHDDSDPENPDYETCANCGKDIAYCVDMTGPQEVTVGADCAIALTSGATKEAIEKFIKDEKKVLRHLS